jgi:predicted house-cleaning noncanonical NTP pyrophosphatase (MazG superfamily)
MTNQEISLLDIKTALRDKNFRDKLPKHLEEDVRKFLQNPNCTCNFKIYQKIYREAQKEIKEFFPSKEYKNLDQSLEELAKNNFSVINCSIGELESRLKSLPPGRKQIAIARYENQITIIVNELEIIY